ncbi:MAG: glycosyltransferase, partial [Gemmatimonadetes bacterium]|nr:glycosyltransferase family 2 protein [Gemmatimonadota bacterium]NIQ53251.1 glycosyltransferase family 2 protein [Gemmatimonadota bacterium]NIU73391.1 glycosyltransferase [Gammaproteobacteria bacterium]NIX43617.1 glycosyltransferase [Gemmatimonadota bacterium]NIY07812.1 glycosyltransferase [Gemmatimonadota bacterium]
MAGGSRCCRWTSLRATAPTRSRSGASRTVARRSASGRPNPTSGVRRTGCGGTRPRCGSRSRASAKRWAAAGATCASGRRCCVTVVGTGTWRPDPRSVADVEAGGRTEEAAGGRRPLAIIPAYDAAHRVGDVVRGASRHLPVLVVDDGSEDETAAVARAAGGTVVRQSPNQGKGAALQAGFRHALGLGVDAVVTLDADGQHDPAEIPAFLEA